MLPSIHEITHMSPKALFVLTSVDRYPTSAGRMAGQPTGYHMDEMAAPYWALRDAGLEVDFASTSEGTPPVDPTTLGDPGRRIPTVQRFLDDPASQERVAASTSITQRDASAYDMIVLVGGHGVMWDLRESAPLATFVGQMFARGAVVGAVCHGPAGLLNAVDAAGDPIVAGRRINAFTDDEEKTAGFGDVVPYFLESELRAKGARFENAFRFQSHAVRDGNLVTGQNPMSVKHFSALLLEALQARVTGQA